MAQQAGEQLHLQAATSRCSDSLPPTQPRAPCLPLHCLCSGGAVIELEGLKKRRHWTWHVVDPQVGGAQRGGGSAASCTNSRWSATSWYVRYAWRTWREAAVLCVALHSLHRLHTLPPRVCACAGREPDPAEHRGAGRVQQLDRGAGAGGVHRQGGVGVCGRLGRYCRNCRPAWR